MHELVFLRVEPKPPYLAGGFTLLEALVVLAVVGVLVALAAPSVSGIRARHQLQAQAEGLLDSLMLSRSEALRRQQRVTLCPRTSENACDASAPWQNGWLVFMDVNDNAQREPEEPLIEVHGDVPPSVRMGVTSTVKGYFSYGSEGRSQSTGGAFMAGTWRFCQAKLPEGWLVVSNALGKPRIEKYSPQTCP